MRGKPNKRGRGRPPKVRYRKLRARMETLGLSAESLGEVCGISGSGISRRLAGETPWQLWEAYEILKLIGEPPERIYLFFPANGEDVDALEERRLRSYLAETNQSVVADSALDALVALVHGIEDARRPGATA